jgi:hypothetical protein
MTKKERDLIRARCETTTTGLWKIGKDYGLLCCEITNEDRAVATVCIKEHVMQGDGKEPVIEIIPELMANAEFIANAKKDMIALLDDLDSLEQEKK